MEQWAEIRRLHRSEGVPSVRSGICGPRLSNPGGPQSVVDVAGVGDDVGVLPLSFGGDDPVPPGRGHPRAARPGLSHMLTSGEFRPGVLGEAVVIHPYRSPTRFLIELPRCRADIQAFSWWITVFTRPRTGSVPSI